MNALRRFTYSRNHVFTLLTGILNLDKPPGISSAFAVGRVKRMLPKKTKIGHAGTLDPFATGVLLLLIGKSTKQCEQLMDQPKQYETTIRFGATTETDDLESPEILWPHQPLQIPSLAQIQLALPTFVGSIQQRPPIYSALKIGGKPAYKLAREGKPQTLASRIVTVYSIDLLEYTWPSLRIRIDCGRGTYVRSIARDLGEQLNVGGYLTQLRRTRVGDFTTDNAVQLDSLTPESISAKLQT